MKAREKSDTVVLGQLQKKKVMSKLLLGQAVLYRPECPLSSETGIQKEGTIIAANFVKL